MAEQVLAFNSFGRNGGRTPLVEGDEYVATYKSEAYRVRVVNVNGITMVQMVEGTDMRGHVFTTLGLAADEVRGYHSGGVGFWKKDPPVSVAVPAAQQRRVQSVSRAVPPVVSASSSAKEKDMGVATASNESEAPKAKRTRVVEPLIKGAIYVADFKRRTENARLTYTSEVVEVPDSEGKLAVMVKRDATGEILGDETGNTYFPNYSLASKAITGWTMTFNKFWFLPGQLPVSKRAAKGAAEPEAGEDAESTDESEGSEE